MNAGCEWFNNETANVIIGSFPFIQSHLVMAWVVGCFAHSGFINVTLLWSWPEVDHRYVCVCVPSQPEPPPVFPVQCRCLRCLSVKTWLCLSGRPAVSLYPSAGPGGSLSAQRETGEEKLINSVVFDAQFTYLPDKDIVLASVSALNSAKIKHHRDNCL